MGKLAKRRHLRVSKVPPPTKTDRSYHAGIVIPRETRRARDGTQHHATALIGEEGRDSRPWSTASAKGLRLVSDTANNASAATLNQEQYENDEHGDFKLLEQLPSRASSRSSHSLLDDKADEVGDFEPAAPRFTTRSSRQTPVPMADEEDEIGDFEPATPRFATRSSRQTHVSMADEEDEDGDFEPATPRFATRSSRQAPVPVADEDDEDGDFEPASPRFVTRSFQKSLAIVGGEEDDFEPAAPRLATRSSQTLRTSRSEEDDEEGDVESPPLQRGDTMMKDIDASEGDFEHASMRLETSPPASALSNHEEEDEDSDFEPEAPRSSRGPRSANKTADGKEPLWRVLTAGDLDDEDDDEDEDYEDEAEEERDPELEMMLELERQLIARWGTSVPEGYEAPTQRYEDYDDGLTEEEARVHIAALCVDHDGRIMLEGGVSALLDYDFLSFDQTLEGDATVLAKDCEHLATADKAVSAAYSAGSTYWVPGNARRSSLSALEALALDIFEFHAKKHFARCRGPRVALSRCGAEWWTLAMDRDEGEVGWHWDRDYAAEDGGVNVPPHLATVTYLADVGAPTVVLPVFPKADASLDFSGKTESLYVSLPRTGKHISFDGRFLHAAVDEIVHGDDAPLTPPAPSLTSPRRRRAARSMRRVTLLVNIWLDWQPEDCDVLPAELRAKLAKPATFAFKPTHGHGTSLVSQTRLIELPVKINRRATRTNSWSFRVRKHKAKVAIAMPLIDLTSLGESSFHFHRRQSADGSTQNDRQKSGSARPVQFPLAIVRRLERKPSSTNRTNAR